MNIDHIKERENKAQLRFLIEEIIDKLDLRDLPRKDLNEFKDNLEKEINRRIGAIVLENLNDEALKEYEEFIDKDPAKAGAIVREHIPDLGDKIRRDISDIVASFS
jgi:hypothetical protein